MNPLSKTTAPVPPGAVMSVVKDINDLGGKAAYLTENDIKLGTFIVGRTKVGKHWMKKGDCLELQMTSRKTPQKFFVCDIIQPTKHVKIISTTPGAKAFLVPYDKFL